MSNMFTTRNRKLEQFLFCHEIRHNGFTKDQDGMTVWQYIPTPELMHVVQEFRDIQERKALMTKPAGGILQ